MIFNRLGYLVKFILKIKLNKIKEYTLDRLIATFWVVLHQKNVHKLFEELSINKKLISESKIFSKKFNIKSKKIIKKLRLPITGGIDGAQGGGGGNIFLIYLLTRKIKPIISLETGVSAGKSTSSILQAKEKNKIGKLYSSDLNTLLDKKDVGILVSNFLKYRWRLFNQGDLHNLPKILNQIKFLDLFYYDSVKSYKHKNKVFKLILNKFTPKIILVDDIERDSWFKDFFKQNNLDYKIFIIRNLGILIRIDQLEAPKGDNKIRIRTKAELESRKKNFLKICKILDDLKIFYFIQGGTLLGAKREKQFIKWDWDVEISLFHDDFKKNFNKIKKKLIKNNFSILKYNSNLNLKIDCYKEFNSETTTFTLLGWSYNKVKKIYHRGNINIPKRFLNKYDEIYFYKKKFFAPYTITKYLSYQYGNWRLKKRSSVKREYMTEKFYKEEDNLKRLKRLIKILINKLKNYI